MVVVLLLLLLWLWLLVWISVNCVCCCCLMCVVDVGFESCLYNRARELDDGPCAGRIFCRWGWRYVCINELRNERMNE